MRTKVRNIRYHSGQIQSNEKTREQFSWWLVLDLSYLAAAGVLGRLGIDAVLLVETTTHSYSSILFISVTPFPASLRI